MTQVLRFLRFSLKVLKPKILRYHHVLALFLFPKINIKIHLTKIWMESSKVKINQIMLFENILMGQL